jgi:uncharacterized membrane protein
MQGLRRRVVYVTLFELFAIGFASLGFVAVSGQDITASSGAAAACSAIAIVWNVLFNHAFERWESRQAQRRRTLMRRVAHAVGFESGLTLFLVPLMAWWLGVSLWQAFWMDIGLLLFFLGYAFVFNWLFDRVFGPPLSAVAPAA